jgi:hypothetical protein
MITGFYAVYGEAMIWVVDSTNRGSLLENAEELTAVLGDIDAYKSIQKDATSQKDYLSHSDIMASFHSACT